MFKRTSLRAILGPRLVVGALGVLFALAAGAPDVRAAAYPPPPGKVFAGLTGGIKTSDYESFAALIGKRPPVWQLFLTWDYSAHAPQYVRARLQYAAQNRIRLMLHFSMANSNGGEAITSAAVANGSGDAYLLAMNGEIAASGQIVYVRPFAEPNQSGNVYSAGRGGAARSAGNYRKAFQRTALIMRGGALATVNARLRALGMPPVRGAAGAIPMPQVALMWCPHVTSSPATGGNSPGAYHPGGAYYDWMCTDIFSGGAPFGQLAGLYSSFGTGKPFAIGEWGFDTGDAPSFVTGVFGFARSHPRVKMILFNQGNRPGSSQRIERRPRSAAALRSALRSPVYPPAG